MELDSSLLNTWTRASLYRSPGFLLVSYHHHHHVVLLARISLTLSRHFSLSFISSGRSSWLHPVSSHSCWMYVRAGRPAFVRPCVGVVLLRVSILRLISCRFSMYCGFFQRSQIRLASSFFFFFFFFLLWDLARLLLKIPIELFFLLNKIKFPSLGFPFVAMFKSSLVGFS